MGLSFPFHSAAEVTRDALKLHPHTTCMQIYSLTHNPNILILDLPHPDEVTSNMILKKGKQNLQGLWSDGLLFSKHKLNKIVEWAQ